MEEETILYSFPSCHSSRRVKQWLDLNKIKYTERKVLREPITREDILTMLKFTEGGFEDLIAIKTVNDESVAKSLEELKFNQFIDYICTNPNLLKKPILMMHGKLFVGWNRAKFREVSMAEQQK